MHKSLTLHEALRQLEQTFVPCVIERNPDFEYVDWYELLGFATKSISADTKKVDSLRIAEFWMAHFAAVVVSSNVMGLYSKDMDSFVELVLTNNLVETIAAQDKHMHLLAWLCVARASLVEYEACLPENGNRLRQLLEQWLKRAVSTETLGTMQGMIDHVHGPGAWVLYSNEVQYLSTLPQRLYELHLPIHLTYATNTQPNIPDTMW